MPDTPHKISLGFACGVFVSFSPVFGLHFVYAALLAVILRGNVLAALLGTFFGNPLTFPFIATISYRLGLGFMGLNVNEAEALGLRDAILVGITGTWHSLLSLVGLSEPAWGQVNDFFQAVFIPYFVGGLLPGLVAGCACYFLARPIVSGYQARRRTKLATRARRRRIRNARAADPAE